MRRKYPKFDLKLKYRRTLEVGLIISLMLSAGVFLASKEFQFAPKIHNVEQIVLEVEDIPITDPVRPPPPPARPSIVIEDASMDPEADFLVPIDISHPFEGSLPLPPLVTTQEKAIPFFQAQEPPTLIGGPSAVTEYIMRHRLYPEMAQMAESDGDVILYFTVMKDGTVSKCEVFQERPEGLGFGQAAITAMLAMKFKPGKQRDKAVAVRMQQTIRFRMK